MVLVSDITDYVLGFYFLSRGTPMDTPVVLLITKARPEWQAGKLNGIGGHVEPGEAPREAMTREFFEETGIRHHDWAHFLTMRFPDSRVYCYSAIVDAAEHPPAVLKPRPDEPVAWYSVNSLPPNVLTNLQWLVPMAYYDNSRPVYYVF
jgi:8-oxo-dGTP diphosphatase